MPALEIASVSKAYGSNVVLNNVSATIEKGELVTLLGPSGCGKTTLLRAVAGLTDIDKGAVLLNGMDVTKTPIHKRNIGMVFQSHALFPNMTVADNVGFGLRMQGMSAAERVPRISTALELVQLKAMEARLPHQLSGGQQQRVAIARAITTNPTILLLDEPFGALDRKLRGTLQVELRNLTKELGITAIFVTHDQEEAVILSDRIAVMNGGVIQQIGSPSEIYEQPANRFVADFMGFENVIEARAVSTCAAGTVFQAGTRDLLVKANVPLSGGHASALAIRAERINLSKPLGGADQTNALSAKIMSSSYRGNAQLYQTTTELGVLVVRSESHSAPYAVGEDVVVNLNPSALKVLN